MPAMQSAGRGSLAQLFDNTISAQSILADNDEMDLLTSLGAFARIAETGSFSSVARETGASQSAVTRLIGQLEDHFGVRLFHRTTRRLSLTEDGHDLLGYARHLLASAEEMQSAIGRQRSSPTGLVRLWAPVGVSAWLVPRIPQLLERYPGLALEMVIGDQFGNMIDDRLDVAILGLLPPENSSLITRALGSWGRITVASQRYLERHGAPSRPEDLVNHACIIHETGPGSTSWQFGPDDNKIEVEVSGPFHANNSTAVQRAAVAGIGIARLNELQVSDDIRAGRLYRLLPDYLPERRQAYVAYPSRRHVPPRVRVTIDFVVEHARDLFDRVEKVRVTGESEFTWLV